MNPILEAAATRVEYRSMTSLTGGRFSSVLAVGVMAYGCRIGRQRRAPLTSALALLTGAALSLKIDLVRPRAGLIQLSDAPLESIDFEMLSQ